MYELTVVIPTFNEHDNVAPMVDLLTKALQGRAWEAVFVDDDSPDGTADAVRAIAEVHPNIRVLHRTGRRGLAGACIEGILSSTATFCAVIDADLQHDETRLPVMFDLLAKDPVLDLVVGSRKIDGGEAAQGFSAIRQWGSNRATNMTRRALRITISDPMSGFFMLRRSRFNIIARELQVAGFKILADMLAVVGGAWKVVEVPFSFRHRQFGDSKMDSAVALEFLGLLVARMTGGLVSIRLVLFVMVGLVGVAVQLTVVGAVLWLTSVAFTLAQTAGVTVAIANNFLLNNLLTYKDRALTGWALLSGMISFYIVCSIGAVLNIGLARQVFDFVPVWPLASAAGAVAGAAWNFGASSLFTWRAR